MWLPLRGIGQYTKAVDASRGTGEVADSATKPCATSSGARPPLWLSKRSSFVSALRSSSLQLSLSVSLLARAARPSP